jgi:hypothetical protein
MALEHILKTGGARAVGVSNYEVNHLDDIKELGGLMPAASSAFFFSVHCALLIVYFSLDILSKLALLSTSSHA